MCIICFFVLGWTFWLAHPMCTNFLMWNWMTTPLCLYSVQNKNEQQKNEINFEVTTFLTK
jgi:hypothetical protein